MAATPSTMLPVGTVAPDFSLPSAVTGKNVSLGDFVRSRALVVMFICNHCPFVKHIRDQLVAVSRDYGSRGVAFVAINSNDTEKYPDDSPDKMREEAALAGYTFPYLFDETQSVAKAYRAACTPDFYLFDSQRRLIYRGQLDDSRPKNGLPVTGKDLRAAIDALLAGSAPPAQQLPSIGCNIKWKPGNEPDYAR
ncbi:MAG: thioredoxin family protein [Phycisphaerales bacterium]